MNYTVVTTNLLKLDRPKTGSRLLGFDLQKLLPRKDSNLNYCVQSAVSYH